MKRRVGRATCPPKRDSANAEAKAHRPRISIFAVSGGHGADAPLPTLTDSDEPQRFLIASLDYPATDMQKYAVTISRPAK
jgi:hypothetical protein